MFFEEIIKRLQTLIKKSKFNNHRMPKRSHFTFPHSLMIFILNDYSVNNNRTTNLNDFIQKSNIGDNTSTIAQKQKIFYAF